MQFYIQIIFKSKVDVVFVFINFYTKSLDFNSEKVNNSGRGNFFLHFNENDKTKIKCNHHQIKGSLFDFHQVTKKFFFLADR